MKKHEHKQFIDKLMTQYHLRVFGNNDYWLYINGVYAKVDELTLQGIIKDNLSDDSCDANTIRSLTKLWCMDSILRRSWANIQKSTDPYLLNFKNGLLDTKTMTFHHHTPNVESFIQLNADYNVQAVYPKFRNYLSYVLPDTSNQLRLQELFGIALTSHLNLQKLYVLLGEGGTGKSTALRVLENILGEKSYSSVALHELSKNFYAAQIHMKLANISADLPDANIEDAAMLKMLTGGDRITTASKYQSLFEYRSFATQIFSSNYYPKFSGKIGSEITRRLEIISFENVIPEHMKYANFENDLFDETSGIVNWAIEGLLRLYKNNFKLTAPVGALGKKQIVEKDSIAAFINERTIIVDDKSLNVAASFFHNEYEKFCFDYGIKPHKANVISKYIENNYPNVEKKREGESRIMSYVGIGFKDLDSNLDQSIYGQDIPCIDYEDQENIPFEPPTGIEYEEMMRSSEGYDSSQYDDGPILDYEFPEVVVDIPNEINFDGRHFS